MTIRMFRADVRFRAEGATLGLEVLRAFRLVAGFRWDRLADAIAVLWYSRSSGGAMR